jgi:hypothetical protein
MNDLDIVPAILQDLVDRANSVEQVTPEVLEEYFTLLDNDESFVPELIAMVGRDTFGVFVRCFGGQSLRIPRAEDILGAVRRSHEQQ